MEHKRKDVYTEIIERTIRCPMCGHKVTLKFTNDTVFFNITIERECEKCEGVFSFWLDLNINMCGQKCKDLKHSYGEPYLTRKTSPAHGQGTIETSYEIYEVKCRKCGDIKTLSEEN